MASTSDKARFYLEQSVPELQEFSRKKIFSKDEITSIAKRRSDWEYKLNARGSMPSDYARYAEYEMNLETLRRKRVQRLGVKTSNHTGQRRIFFILDRATKKFQGDIGLWMQYISFARKQKSHKKVSQILTSVLRLHPTKPELWIYAANYVMEERGDMTEARSHMQRALRFCKTDRKLWVEYGRLELMWIAKILSRRRILGLDEDREDENGDAIQEIDGDEVTLPKITAEDINPNQRNDEAENNIILDRLAMSPALSGAIPMAIYDSAMKQIKNDENLQIDFYDMVAEFHNLPCTENISNHIMEAMQPLMRDSPAVLIRFIQQPVIGVSVDSHEFPTRFGLCLDRMKHAFEKLVPCQTTPKTARPRGILGGYITEWFLPYLEQHDLDADIRIVILSTLKKVWNRFQLDNTNDPSGRGVEVTRLIGLIRAQGFHKIADPAAVWARGLWPEVTV